ncbi:MAG: hypothetical protein RIS47_914, partial [Bacteroidota bacterium]
MEKKLCLTRWWPKNDYLRKTLKIMKLSLLFIVLSMNYMYADNGYAQSTRLNMNMKDASVKEVLKNIEENSDFFFLYNSKLVDVDRIVNVQFENKNISEVLKFLFRNTEVAYAVVDKQIVLTNKANLDSFGKFGGIRSGQATVSGTVVSATDGIAIPGVSILEKGTSNGTISGM